MSTSDSVTPVRAVLTDFGGVLTTSVMAAFRSYSTKVAGDPYFFEKLFRDAPEAGALLVEHECGRMRQAEFEDGITALLAERGIAVQPPGFVAAIQAHLQPDNDMLDAVQGLRQRGVPVALVSNSLGDDCYRGFDLEELADVVVISAEVGTRKPGRRIYQIACDRLGVAASECVLIDDLEQNLAGAARLGIRGLLHVDSSRTLPSLAEMLGGPLSG